MGFNAGRPCRHTARGERAGGTFDGRPDLCYAADMMQMSVPCLTLSLCALLSACAPYSGMAAHAHAAGKHDYRCADEQVTVRQIRRNTFDVRACGHDAVYQCHGYQHNCADLTDLAKRRAAAEFNCPGPVQASEINPFVFSVSGCSQKVTYRCQMRGGLASCASEGAALR